MTNAAPPTYGYDLLTPYWVYPLPEPAPRVPVRAALLLGTAHSTHQLHRSIRRPHG